jgi:hypothetical protein
MTRIRIAEECQTKRVSRGDGALLRHLIEQAWKVQPKVVLDFEGVRIASVSFFDEAIGLLARQHPLKELTARLSVENITPADRNLLNQIVLSRAKERRNESTPPAA